MTSNGSSGGDYQAVEASETRRKRINQVVRNLFLGVESVGPPNLNLAGPGNPLSPSTKGS